MFFSVPLLFLGRVRALYFDNQTGVLAPCDSQIFCYGPLLRDIELAQPFDDSKTFVDLPTIRPVSDVISAYQNLTKPITNDTALQDFLTSNFGSVGTELGPVNGTLTTNPTFLSHVNSSVVSDFVRQVVGIWPDLTRQVVPQALCDGCDSSFIPPARPFVVAGGRFREAYYWDSFFILEGLLRTEGNYTEIAKNTIENFLDFIETYGFVPNGARKYYLNRSQPPLLGNMIQIYIETTNDTSILERVLPLLLTEQSYFEAAALVKYDTSGANETLFRYLAQNNQPRPESYYEDYTTAHTNGTLVAAGALADTTSTSETARTLLYQNLASAAESGWDFSSRWLSTLPATTNDTATPLAALNTVDIVPVDLQAIQYSNAKLISSFYSLAGNQSASRAWSQVAIARANVLEKYHYNETLGSYFDYNLTSGRQNTMVPPRGANTTQLQFFSPAQFFPLAFGAARARFDSDYEAVLDLYEPIVQQLDTFPGGISATNVATGQQWDQPNAWPPLQYILIRGLLASLPDSRLATGDPGYAKVQALALRLAQRYVDSTYCTWRATGGSHPTLGIPQLSGLDPSQNGTMFEKYSSLAINAVGEGGEYSTVEGFGWSNGVLIWVADLFGGDLVTPQCDTMNTSVRRSLRPRGLDSGLRFQQRSRMHT